MNHECFIEESPIHELAGTVTPWTREEYKIYDILCSQAFRFSSLAYSFHYGVTREFFQNSADKHQKLCTCLTFKPGSHFHHAARFRTTISPAFAAPVSLTNELWILDLPLQYLVFINFIACPYKRCLSRDQFIVCSNPVNTSLVYLQIAFAHTIWMITRTQT